MQYNHQKIEERWQQFWAENQTFKATNNSDKPKYYVGMIFNEVGVFFILDKIL